MSKIEYKKIYFPNGHILTEPVKSTDAIPVEEIHAGIFHENYGIIRTQTINNTKHIWLDSIYGKKFQKIVFYRISIIPENDNDIFNERKMIIPRSMYKKDKRCVINGKTYIMKNIIDRNYKYSRFSYTSPTSSYSCLI